MSYQGIDCKKDLESERDAILKFLGKYWNVRVKDDKSLSEVVYSLLEEGFNYGIILQELKTEEAVKMYNENVDVINNFNKKTVAEPLEFSRSTTGKERNFEFFAGELEKELLEKWKISAQPKGYRAFKKKHYSENFAEIDENIEFGGLPLHSDMAATCIQFPILMQKGHIYYNEEDQGNSPLSELVGAVLRQGMTIGMNAVEKKYGKPIEIAVRIKDIGSQTEDSK